MLERLLLRLDHILRQALPLIFPQTSIMYGRLMGLGKLDELILLIFRYPKKPEHDHQ
jgi:hypothetical protein